MTRHAVAAGMTPYRPSPLPPVPDPGGRSDAPGGPGPGRLRQSWRTPSCVEDLAAWYVRGAPAVTEWSPTGPAGAGVSSFLSERQPGGWACMGERWAGAVAPAGVVDGYLTPVERALYHGLSPVARASWLLGRVAAKDAVRWWLADRGLRLAPLGVAVANEPSGRPVLGATSALPADALDDLDLRVSIAHVAGTGVAIVAQGRDVGIDVEETAPRPRSFARVAFSATERDERARATGGPVGRPTADPHAAMDDATWMAAAWCAKEAAGKADGTGLQGRPTRFVTSLVGPDLFRVGGRLVRCTRLDPVRYCSRAGHPLVVGWTLSGGGGRTGGALGPPGTGDG